MSYLVPRTKTYTSWEKTFAYLPVYTITDKWVWWDWVYVRVVKEEFEEFQPRYYAEYI